MNEPEPTGGAKAFITKTYQDRPPHEQAKALRIFPEPHRPVRGMVTLLNRKTYRLFPAVGYTAQRVIWCEPDGSEWQARLSQGSMYQGTAEQFLQELERQGYTQVQPGNAPPATPHAWAYDNGYDVVKYKPSTRPKPGVKYRYTKIYRTYSDVQRGNTVRVVWREEDGSEWAAHEPQAGYFLVKELERRGFENADRWHVHESRARRIIEKLTGPAPEQVKAIAEVILASPTWQEANERLEPYGVVFMDSHPILVQTGALGGYDPEYGKVVLNAAYFPIPEKFLYTAIEHELTHADQMARAAERGGDPQRIVGSRVQQMQQLSGNAWRKRYARDPLEMQALARNAVSAARRAGRNPTNLLRRGRLGSYAPLPPGDTKRFGKYAYQMSQEP